MSRVVAWVLVVAWIVLGVLIWREASREATYDELLRGLRSGEVTEVSVVGDISTARSTGGVELQWDDGLLWDRHTQVIGANPVSQVRSESGTVVKAPVAETLRTRFPGATVRTDGDPVGADAVWVLALGLAAMVGTVLLVVTTPGPLRATRWAWLWISGVLPPVGALAFLLLGGPTGAVPARQGAPRLGGGWAFVLALVVGTVSANAWVFA